MRLDTLYKSLLLPTFGVLLLGAVVASSIITTLIGERMSADREGAVRATSELLAGVSGPYVINFDLTALGNLVKQLARDPELVFAEVVDDQNRSLTEDAMAAPDSLEGTLRMEQPVLDSTGKAIGTVRLAYRTTGVALLRNAAAITVAASMLVLALLVGAVLTLAARRVIGQIGAEPREVAALAARVADGDLTVSIALRPGDTHSVLYAMQRMVEQLRSTTQRIHEVSRAIALASDEIAQSNHALSVRTEQQTAALEQTSVSMHGLGNMVGKNAESAQQVNTLSNSASRVAAQGGEVVGQVVDRMREIHHASGKISDIIAVIDGIAFQTNILALNAAVEAARAGEQGRGFAVVASEVRALAGRSAEASKEIKTLITDSVTKVEQGSALVDQAGTTMGEVVTSIAHVAQIMQEISSASHEQQLGVTHVKQALAQMDQSTQQDAALVEEMTASASSLKTQAQALMQVISVFRFAHETDAVVSS